MHSEDERYQRGLGHGCSRRMHSEGERYHGLGMDPLVIGCTWNTNVIMVWAWMLRLLDVLGTRTSIWFGHGCSGERMHSEHALLWFGHGCSGERMHSEHERYYGLGMDALVSICTRKTNVISAGLGMDALVGVRRRRTLLGFAHGYYGEHLHSEHERYDMA